jgi:predicted ferric reductase
MLAKKYLSEIISINNPFAGIYTIECKSLGRPFKYQPGQFLHIAIDDNYDGIGQWPESRCFSMQSNPNEEYIQFTFAVKGVFTKQMEEALKQGSEVWLKLPYGDLFSQTHSKENTVFIAGGTGITPFLSLFTHETFKDYNNPRIYLGFRSEKYNIYQKDLAQSCNGSQSLNIFNENIDGILNIQNIFNKNGINSNYFISGPPMMIKSFKQSLIENGVDARNILTDDWE